MGRIPRKLLVDFGSVHHCIWRAHNHERVFDAEGARECFLRLLAKYKAPFGIRIFAFCLMGTHPHLVCVADRGQLAFSAFWKVVNHGFACWYNRRHHRRGQVVMERLLSLHIQPGGQHLLNVMRYGDLNPVRAGLVRSPKQWAWSSYRHYAFGERHPLIDDAPDYLGLGPTPAARRKAYQALLSLALSIGLRVRRKDLSEDPFIGDDRWVTKRRKACGRPPPS